MDKERVLATCRELTTRLAAAYLAPIYDQTQVSKLTQEIEANLRSIGLARTQEELQYTEARIIARCINAKKLQRYRAVKLASERGIAWPKMPVTSAQENTA